MKRIFSFLLGITMILSFTNCTEQKETNISEDSLSESQTVCISSTERDYITPVGEVPDAFKSVVDNNLLNCIRLSGKNYYFGSMLGSSYTIEKYNFNFEKLATYTYTLDESDVYYNIGSVISTSDGGFIFTLVSSSYQRDNGTWSYKDSILIKCDIDGVFEWKYLLKNYSAEALGFIYEVNGFYYIIGVTEESEGEIVGESSYTDIYALKIDNTGNLISEKSYGGSDFEMLWNCEMINNQFELLINTQSNDGDFHVSNNENSVTLKVVLDEDLNVVSYTNSEYDYSEIIGILDGVNVYSDRGILADFADGTSTALIDYGDYYLVVSEHVTGQVENQPLYISTIWYYTETVYGAYKKNGTLIWKTAVDSTPSSYLDYNSSEDIFGIQ